MYIIIATNIIAARTMNQLYIWLDLIFLLIFSLILLKSKRYQAFIVGLIGGLLYFVVDYGYFFLLLHTRQITGADPFWFLLWLSMSYGFTNFAWIWLWLDHDGHALEWSLIIVTGWLSTALLSQNFGAAFQHISIMRGTAAYHGIMALLLFVGYTYLAVHNIACKTKDKRYPIVWILVIGILVQFSWEFVLNLTGIRNQDPRTLAVNSLLETNLGLPYLFLIHRAINRRWDESLKRPAAL